MANSVVAVSAETRSDRMVNVRLRTSTYPSHSGFREAVDFVNRAFESIQ